MMIELQVRTGYLYLLKNNILGGYKVGITTAPASRFKALGVGTKSTLVAYWKLDAYRELEKQLHKEHAAKRVPQSEWFDLSDEEVASLIQRVTSIAETEFIIPEMVQEFAGPHYKITKVPAYQAPNYSAWNTFGLIAVSFVLGYLLSAY